MRPKVFENVSNNVNGKEKFEAWRMNSEIEERNKIIEKSAPLFAIR